MRPSIVARNYAETLLALAERNGGTPTVEAYLAAADEVAAALTGDARVRAFLETPRVGVEQKQQVLRAAFGGRVPELFLRFLLVVAGKRRQGILPQIAAAYRDLVDARMGRVRADVRIAHEPDAALRDEVRASLERRLGKAVLPTFTVDPALLGGMVVRVEGQVMDGSLRTRARDLRRRLLGVELPETAAAG
jgi:F-type H+-transporting ATPase subunit delta